MHKDPRETGSRERSRGVGERVQYRKGFSENKRRLSHPTRAIAKPSHVCRSKLIANTTNATQATVNKTVRARKQTKPVM